MRRFFLFLLIFFVFTLKPAFAQDQALMPQERITGGTFPTSEYYRAKVIKIIEEGNRDIAGYKQPFQNVKVQILSGKEYGKIVQVDQGLLFTIKDYQKVKLGEEVVLTKTLDIQKHPIYVITDKYRIPPVIFIALIFFALVIFWGRLRGFTSILSMVLSLLILTKFIIPAILSGQNPMAVSLLGAVGIALLSLYLAHGINKRITIALISTLITLCASVALATLFVSLAKLSGAGTEEAYYLQMGTSALNLKGLLLGGIIIGALGVLDDITTGQAASIDEISKANPELGFSELYKRGISVGREHIASLVNTLVLAYAGASFPVFLLFLMLKDQQPLWITLNSEFVVEEIIRTLVGSTTLVLAVPLTTFLAAYYYGRKRVERKKKS